MGNIGSPMPGSIPAVGTPGTGYAVSLDTFLTEVKARLESDVPLASLQAGTFDLSNNPVVNVEYLGLYTQLATPTTPVGSLQSFGGDLWWINTGGAVQITSGTTINSAAVKGLTGDYGTGAEQLRYITANTEYYTYSNFGTGTYAYLWTRGLDIAGAATGSNRVRVLNSGGNYTLTLPTAVPGSTSLVQMDNSGNLTATNTLASNQSITLQGSGYYKHGVLFKTQVVTGLEYVPDGSGGTTGVVNNTPGLTFGNSAGGYLAIQIPLDHAQITAITLYNTITGTGNWTVRLYQVTGSAPDTLAAYGTSQTISAGTTPSASVTATGFVYPIFNSNGAQFWLRINTGAANAGVVSAIGIQYQVV